MVKKLENYFKQKIESTMLDPSLLCTIDFWENSRKLPDIFREIYFPESIKLMTDFELRKFYGIYLSEERMLGVKEIANRSQENFRSFSFRSSSKEVPEPFREGYSKLRRGLERSTIPKSIQNTFLDEFVFLTVHSSILSRMKKSFKIFEKFNAFPLLNLEKRAPEEWRDTVRGIKWTIKAVNWIAFSVVFSLYLGPVAGTIAGKVVDGIRLLLVDPV